MFFFRLVNRLIGFLSVQFILLVLHLLELLLLSLSKLLMLLYLLENFVIIFVSGDFNLIISALL